MAGNKKPRKAYKPRACTPMAGLWKLASAAVADMAMTDEDAGELEMVVLTALEVVAKGQGTPNEWNSIARAINHSWTLAKGGIGPEVMPILTQAEEAMKRAGERFYKHGRLGLDGDGLQAVRESLALWGDQIRMCKVGEVDAATRLVEAEYWRKAA